MTAASSLPSPQRGVLARPTEHLLTAALQFANRDQTSSRASLDALAEVLHRELAADLDEIVASTAKDQPTSETGEVGVADAWDLTELTIDVGLSATAFDALGYPAGDPNRPQDLIEVPWASYPIAPATPTSGDVLLHIRANDLFVAEHVLRRVEHELAGQFQTVWTMIGTQRYTPNHAAPDRQVRAIIGFHDGLSNPSPTSDPELIFVDPAQVPTYPPLPPLGPQPQPGPYGGGTATTDPTFPTDLRQPPSTEPAWMTGGSYTFIRGSIINTPGWDTTPLGQQEGAVGRFKSSGAFLDNPDTSAHRDDDPAFATTPTNVAVPPNSHVRRSNPRAQASDSLRRFMRRGYPLIAARGGSLERGLLFVSFSRSLSTQVEFVLRAWLFNPNFPAPDTGIDPLLKFETAVIAGGYYFMPAISDPDRPWSWKLPWN